MIEMKLTIDASPALLEVARTFASAFAAGSIPAPVEEKPAGGLPAPVEEPAPAPVEETAPAEEPEPAPAPAPEPAKKAPAKKTTTKKTAAKKAAPAPAKEEAPAAPAITLNDLTRAGADFIDKTGRVDDLTLVLQKKYECSSMINLDAARYADFAADLNRLAAGETAEAVIG